ncbi:MAG: hypothetical protein JSR87_03875 [Proteobacteria bacterium]|nr:hypothetical protein [Pseudomonadota bacterium]MBS0572019.1 hypothetical protein [Pseudomonadota bacterium]
MQRFMFGKVEVWLVLLLAILGLVAALLFGSVVLQTEQGDRRFGRLGAAAVEAATLPLTFETILRNNDTRLAQRVQKLDGKSGWLRAGDGARLAGEGYLLLSRFDGNIEGAAIELVDLRDLTVRYRWQPDATALFADMTPVKGEDDLWSRRYFEAVHPFLLPDGSLIIKDHHTPLFRIDACGRKLWAEQTQIYHHSTERDVDGNLWIPVHVQPHNPLYADGFHEDGLAQVSTDGKLLQVRSMVDIFARNGLTPQLFSVGTFNDDPIHLNDIQPVLADGPYWKKGDLFLSLRRLSTVMLYRPSTGQILWRKQGPWIGQHDVDILDDHRISVFDNRAMGFGKGPVIDGANQIAIYDFATGQVETPMRSILAKLEIKTYSEGLLDLTGAGNLLVEEENSGHLLILAPDGTLLAEYVNRDDRGRVFTTSWSRTISRAEGDSVLAAIKAAPACP